MTAGFAKFTAATLLAPPRQAPELEPEVDGFRFRLPHPHGCHRPPFRLLGLVVGAPPTAVVQPTVRALPIVALIVVDVI